MDDSSNLWQIKEGASSTVYIRQNTPGFAVTGQWCDTEVQLLDRMET